MKGIEVRLADICEVITKGTTPSNIGEEFTTDGVRYIRSEMINSSKNISEEGVLYISEETHDKLKRSQLKSGDILFSMAGVYLGKTAILRERDVPANTNQAVALIRVNPKKCNREYIYYFLNLPAIVKSVNSMTAQAAQPNINLRQIGNIPIVLPPQEVQDRVVAVISPYDDLIENNQRQIKLLEEAAQRLYKEWFVDLRFPGHENTKIIDGVPEGWRMAVLSEIASVNKESISKQYPYDYVDYIDIGAVSKGQINSATRLSTKDAPGRAKRIAFDGDVLWGMVRPNLKSYALVFHPKETSVFSTGFAILHAEKVPFSFLYCHVTQDEFVSYLINCTNGAAYPAVKPSHFENAVLLVPTDMVLSKFHSLVGQMFRQAEILEQKNQQAIEARDRLLPKLMSGEIEV